MRAVLVLLACLSLVACSGVEMKRGEKSHRRQEVPPGPGLFTGEQGEFVIFRWDGPAEEEEDPRAADQEEPDEQGSE